MFSWRICVLRNLELPVDREVTQDAFYRNFVQFGNREFCYIMHMPKPKRKRRGLEMDFIAPHAIEDCMYKLGQLHEQREIPFAPLLSVRLASLDADTCHFELRQRLPAPVSIHGYLNRLDGQSTYVSGLAVLHYRRLYGEAALVLLGLLGLMLVVGPLIGLLYLPLLLIFMLRYRHGAAQEFGRLSQLLTGMLG